MGSKRLTIEEKENQLVFAGQSATQGTRYTYDSNGNILTKTDVATGAVISYAYTDPTWADLLTSYNGESITYDEIGNPLSYRGGMNFTWVRGRKLSSVTINGNTYSYGYDGDGNRTFKMSDSGYVCYVVVEGVMYAEKRNSINERNTLYYLYDENNSIYGFIHNSSDYYFYRFNLQGDVTGILDANGNVVVEYTYDAWGKILSVAGPMASTIGELNPIRYRGYYYDIETGFYYVSSRYYDPEIGRWISADSAISGAGGDILGYNMFAYCFNNPINMDDQSGNWPQWVESAANWVNDKIVQPVKQFVSGVYADIKNYHRYNENEQKVLESHYFSSYKGVPVFRTNGDRSGSFGAIFLTRETNGRDNPEDLLRHEYGHTKQLEQLGVVNYALCIGVPSWQNWGTGEYYNKPWEITADIYGGVQSRNHLQSDIDAGYVYLEASKRGGPLILIFIESR